MRKKILFISILTVLFATVILIFRQQPDNIFDGERISDHNSYTLHFERMNMSDSETMELHKDDMLHVSWQIESGHMDIVIRKENEKPVYQADDRTAGDSADFYVNIPETGSYTIIVSARNAKGWISFLKTDHK